MACSCAPGATSRFHLRVVDGSCGLARGRLPRAGFDDDLREAVRDGSMASIPNSRPANMASRLGDLSGRLRRLMFSMQMVENSSARIRLDRALGEAG